MLLFGVCSRFIQVDKSSEFHVVKELFDRAVFLQTREEEIDTCPPPAPSATKVKLSARAWNIFKKQKNITRHQPMQSPRDCLFAGITSYILRSMVINFKVVVAKSTWTACRSLASLLRSTLKFRHPVLHPSRSLARQDTSKSTATTWKGWHARICGWPLIKTLFRSAYKYSV